MKRLMICLTLVFAVASASTASAEKSLRSVGSNFKVVVTWKNNEQTPIDLKWVDFQGKEVTGKQTIQPGQTFTGNTYSGHVFVFHANQGRLKWTYMVPAGNAVQTIDVIQDLTRDSGRHDYRYKNSTEQGSFICINNSFAGYGMVWRKTAKSKTTGKTTTNYFTESSRTEKYVQITNPITKHSYRFFSDKKLPPIEMLPGMDQWQNYGEGSWYLPR